MYKHKKRGQIELNVFIPKYLFEFFQLQIVRKPGSKVIKKNLHMIYLFD